MSYETQSAILDKFLTTILNSKMMEWEINRIEWINWINCSLVFSKTWWLVFKLLNLLMLSFWYTFYVSFTREQSCGTSLMIPMSHMEISKISFLKFQFTCFCCFCENIDRYCLLTDSLIYKKAWHFMNIFCC